MTVISIYTGVETADSAVLTTGGVEYRCFVWRNASADERIEAMVQVESADGSMVKAHEAIVAEVVDNFVDCPRVLAVGDLFVCHWIDTDLDGAGMPLASSLYRSIIDCTDLLAGWVAQGSVGLHTSNLYDHAIVYNSSPEQFIVARQTAAGIIITTRFEAPFGWTDDVWSQSDGALTIADRVLCCHANEDAQDVIVAYQDALTLQMYRRNATTGLGFAGPNEVFDDLAAGDNHFTAASIELCDANTSDFVVVAEFIDDVNHSAGGARARARGVAWRQINGSSALAQHESQWVYGVQMASRPWHWSDGPASSDIYVALAFQSLADGQEFEQSFVYVARLFWQELQGANGAGVIRPVVCAAMTGGDLDARPHGESPVVGANIVSIGSRMNHVPSPSGPGRSSPAATEGYALTPHGKTMTFAIIRWSRLVATYDGTSTDLNPLQALVGFVRFFHEDPYIVRRDPLESSQPDSPNWEGSSSKEMSRPIAVPTGLVLTGGVLVAHEGTQPVEVGYFWAPEILSAQAFVGGGNDHAGDYFFAVTYSWTDPKGQQHRSPPSTPVRVTVAVGEGVNVLVRPISLTMKDDRRRYPLAGSISVELWRTYVDLVTGLGVVSGGNFLFRREYGLDTPGNRLRDTPPNDPSDVQQLLIGGRANVLIQNTELMAFQLNTQTLQYSPPAPIPHVPLTVATNWRNRLIGVDPREPRELIYSEENLPAPVHYRLPEFLDTNRVRFDGRGEITALWSMDYTVVIFTRDKIFTLEGTPASGGVGATLDIRNVVTGIGCVSQSSIIHTHEGIYFQSGNGIHMIDRGFNVRYIGAPVEQLVERAGNIRGGVHIQESHSVRWALNEDPGTPVRIKPIVLTYDYSVQKWSVDVLVGFAQGLAASRLNEMTDVTAWRGRQSGKQLVVLQQGGLAIERSKDDTVYSDEGAGGVESVGLDVQTEWIKIGDLAGLLNVREIGVTTVRKNPGGMKIDLFYDTDGSFDDTTPAETKTWASPAPAYLLVKPSKIKITAFMLRIRELSPIPATENLRIVSMTVRYMVKPTPRRSAVANIGV